MKNKVILAQTIATHLHGDQLYGGRPYTYHLKQVFDKVNFLYGESPKLKQLQQIAWLHDVLEDTDCKPDQLRDYGFDNEVVTGVLMLSKINGESLPKYYDRVAMSKLALKVKVADTLSNLEHSCREGMTKRINKYTVQIQELYSRK
ncbi:MAG: hypothetical protein GY787_07995 [Alteromonadales bacterium]|nr:hypothetical protein [Alteromonadales bacterium]